jgi:alpha-tubulin suppressor-like RCC1 family protein
MHSTIRSFTFKAPALALLLAVIAAGCGDEDAAGLMLIVDADPTVRDLAALLEIRIRGEKGGDVNDLAPLLYGDDEPIGWPRRVAIAPRDGDVDRTLRVHILAREEGSTTGFVEARVTTGYVDGQRATVRVILAADCIGVECDAEETCFHGSCVDPRDAWLPDTGACGGVPANACGGCGVLAAEPGQSCGGCGLDVYVCNTEESVVCDGDTACWNVTAGGGHTCATDPEGAAWCWGSGYYGTRGDGQSGAAAADGPVRVRVLADEASGEPAWSDWVQVSAGALHNCGLRQNGTLWCWGWNDSGQLGDASTSVRTTPVQVAAAQSTQAPWSDWVAVSAGGYHSCGLRQNGTLWCWGSMALSQLGDGTVSTGSGSRTRPVRVVAAGEAQGGATWNDWIAVSASHDQTCGLRANGTLWCWGASAAGNGESVGPWASPAQVLADEESGQDPWTDWVAVSVGRNFACGRRAGGSLWCWGSRAYGRLGDGTIEASTRTTPARVQAAEESGSAPWWDWISVEAGAEYACGIRRNRTAWCWGRGQDGRRGDGTQDQDRGTPTAVLAEDRLPGGLAWNDWLGISAGGEISTAQTCGSRIDGTLWCWGDRTYGRLGDGMTGGVRITPTPVLESDAP